MEANNVDRFWCEDARNVRCVREADYDSLSKRLHETLEKHRATLSQLEQKERECEELRKDAERYRWIREKVGIDFIFGDFNPWIPSEGVELDSEEKETTDAAIDLAMAKEGAK